MTAGRFSRRIAIAPLFVTALAAACAPGGGGFLGGGVAESDPATLIGLAPQQVGEALGMPELQRREPPAEVWQYRTQTCVFDLYFYDEEDGGRQVAAHFEARSRVNGEIDAAVCLGTVVERPRLASTGDPEPAAAPSS